MILNRADLTSTMIICHKLTCILSSLILSTLISSHLILSHLISYYLFFSSHLILSYLIFSYLILYNLVFFSPPFHMIQEFVTLGTDGTIRLWDVFTGMQKFEFTSPSDEPLCAAYHPSEVTQSTG